MAGQAVDVAGDGIIAQVAGLGITDLARTVVPADGERGFAFGCICRHIDGSGRSDAMYVNVGTNLSCNFDPAPVPDATAVVNLELPLSGWKVWDALQTNLPGTAAADDLGLTTGTFLTSKPTIVSVDFGGTTTTAYARMMLSVPGDYAAGGAMSIIATAAMAVVADASAALDFEVANQSVDETSDICATAAQSINSASDAGVTFNLTPTDVLPGNLLDIRMKFTGTDAGNAQNNINAIIRTVRLRYLRRIT